MDLKKLRTEAIELIEKASSLKELSLAETKYLGRKGILTSALKSISSLPVEKRKSFGAETNQTKIAIEEAVKNKKEIILSGGSKVEVDLTVPGTTYPKGHLHVVTQIYDELFEAGKMLGFSVAEGPEVEDDWHNFEALNIPKDHPSRDTQDSFYFSDNMLLRTHTSPVQVRYMQNHQPPIRIMAPGRVYRVDSDATHTPMFHQLEGLLIDEKVTMSQLKGTLEFFVKRIFGDDRKIRLRPHHFPFTEPSVEVDVSCGLCGGKGCRSCKYSGWLEILGAGMVHPNVLRAGGIDPEKYSGFAFGLGIERIAMLKYGIDDLRLYYEGDLRFVEQF
jgi:phenylalanyl-tRNA synthetase alpha chain